MGLHEQSIPGLNTTSQGSDPKKADTVKGDDPKKADTVKDDLTTFYETLEKAAADGGISQQERGTVTFKNEVESMQVGLILLGISITKLWY